jgi:hypothetical protein
MIVWPGLDRREAPVKRRTAHTIISASNKPGLRIPARRDSPGHPKRKAIERQTTYVGRMPILIHPSTASLSSTSQHTRSGMRLKVSMPGFWIVRVDPIEKPGIQSK